MADAAHPMAPHHLPGFITPPGETDFLFVGAIIFFVILVLMIGSLYFKLHALPERIAHGTSHLQFQLVAVLSLIALFTHNNLFWIAALLLALVPIPDFWTPLANMAESLAVLAGRKLRPISPAGDVSMTNGEPSAAGAAAHPLPPVEISGGTPTRGNDDPSQTMSPAAVDSGPPKPEAPGHPWRGSSPDSPHRAASTEGREP